MRWLLAMVALVALASCDGRYAHARCVDQPDEEACATCCLEEGFSDEVLWKPSDPYVEPDCFCLR